MLEQKTNLCPLSVKEKLDIPSTFVTNKRCTLVIFQRGKKMEKKLENMRNGQQS